MPSLKASTPMLLSVLTATVCTTSTQTVDGLNLSKMYGEREGYNIKSIYDDRKPAQPQQQFNTRSRPESDSSVSTNSGFPRSGPTNSNPSSHSQIRLRSLNFDPSSRSPDSALASSQSGSENGRSRSPMSSPESSEPGSPDPDDNGFLRGTGPSTGWQCNRRRIDNHAKDESEGIGSRMARAWQRYREDREARNFDWNYSDDYLERLNRGLCHEYDPYYDYNETRWQRIKNSSAGKCVGSVVRGAGAGLKNLGAGAYRVGKGAYDLGKDAYQESRVTKY